ncbi:lipoate--protein ligase family protein [Caldisericum exile]|uniref:Lipoate-protein ligase A n=1 Tax=Caldisericum exile (strain DSM 21853 / NBRC 104410 / AZM16c01) TaxID=511051 RepID=A0A7U6GDA0_CALEA|nr:lipoate--protein ligase family protein [Caldisericum exile]BAL80295.1 lipoate-protein ligase A [Caldisericum exile AZM16c01]
MEIEVIESNSFDPFENLKIEQDLFESPLSNKIILRFWVNSPSVIIGKFQKVEYEVNLDLAQSLGIPVLRRFSGGGAVYHDEGVLNMTIIKEKELWLFSNYIIDEAKYLTNLIADAIEKETGNPVRVNERNGIFINYKKIAGSSVAVSRNFLYHISILVNANQKILKEILQGHPYEESEKRFVKSVKSEVINLQEFNPQINIITLKEHLKRHLVKNLHLKIGQL